MPALIGCSVPRRERNPRAVESLGQTSYRPYTPSQAGEITAPGRCRGSRRGIRSAAVAAPRVVGVGDAARTGLVLGRRRLDPASLARRGLVGRRLRRDGGPVRRSRGLLRRRATVEEVAEPCPRSVSVPCRLSGRRPRHPGPRRACAAAPGWCRRWTAGCGRRRTGGRADYRSDWPREPGALPRLARRQPARWPVAWRRQPAEGPCARSTNRRTYTLAPVRGDGRRGNENTGACEKTSADDKRYGGCDWELQEARGHGRARGLVPPCLASVDGRSQYGAVRLDLAAERVEAARRDHGDERQARRGSRRGEGRRRREMAGGSRPPGWRGSRRR